MATLTFKVLREANLSRIPLFKNSKGELAHSQPDGSDWSPAQWLGAVVGELGEFARVRFEYEAGSIDASKYEELARKELADVQIYFDILCRRALDSLSVYEGFNGGIVPGGYPLEDSPAQALLRLVGALGEYANARKKRDRGDFSAEEFEPIRELMLKGVEFFAKNIRETPDLTPSRHHPGDCVETPHPTGIDLGEATVSKFNEVSSRVGADVWLSESRDDAYFVETGNNKEEHP